MLRKASLPYLARWRPLPVQRTISSKLGGNQEDLAQAFLQENKTPPAHKCIPKPGSLLRSANPARRPPLSPQASGHKASNPPGCAFRPHTSSPCLVPAPCQSAVAVFIWGHSQRPHVGENRAQDTMVAQ